MNIDHGRPLITDDLSRDTGIDSNLIYIHTYMLKVSAAVVRSNLLVPRTVKTIHAHETIIIKAPINVNTMIRKDFSRTFYIRDQTCTFIYKNDGSCPFFD